MAGSRFGSNRRRCAFPTDEPLARDGSPSRRGKTRGRDDSGDRAKGFGFDADSVDSVPRACVRLGARSGGKLLPRSLLPWRPEVFEAIATRARIVLPANWRFRGRKFGLAPGRYRWVVQAASAIHRPSATGRRSLRRTGQQSPGKEPTSPDGSSLPASPRRHLL